MESRRHLFCAAAILGAVASTGCATVVNGRHQQVRVFSAPAGADLWVNGRAVGTTPATIRVSRAEAVELRLEKPGYSVTTMTVPRKVSGWVALNGLVLNPYPAAQGVNSTGQWARGAFTWFVLLLGTDVLSGGMFIRPVFVEATLEPLVTPTRSGTVRDVAGSLASGVTRRRRAASRRRCRRRGRAPASAASAGS